MLGLNAKISQTLRYEDAGVSIDRGELLVQRIKSSAASTFGRGTTVGLGGFGAIFDIGAAGYRDPLLVSGADGVGTKLKLAAALNQHDTVGLDLVAMCANDVLVQGATPLFFLDYFACGTLDVDRAGTVIDGIAAGCKLAQCALIGGETAEMPGMYAEGEYDLAGFCVGAVERGKLIDGHAVNAGDVLIGIASSGPHANGYSLIRKLLDDSGSQLTDRCGDRTLGEVLLEPTKLYVSAMTRLFEEYTVKALCHITGGGLTENLPRTLPDHTQAVIDTHSWAWPLIFKWLQDQGNIESREMYRTFNCGVGMVVCVAPKDRKMVLHSLEAMGESAWEIGRINARQRGDAPIQFTV